MRRQTTAAVVTVGALAVTLVVACGSSEPTADEAAAATTAEEVCALLRGWDNEFTDVVNATTGAITDDDDPTTANDTLLSGFDELVALAGDHQEEAAGLALPYTPERARLLAEIEEGTADAVVLLEAERDEIADLPPITVERQGGAIGGALLAVEGAVSAVEPRIELYEDEALRAAFESNAGCDHVVQSDLIAD
jgi:hypothetical protein